jgi:predicted RNase H-like nuclease
MRLFGIDGCKTGWMVASSDARLGELQFEILRDLLGVFDQARRGEAFFVIDIPIGPENGKSRDCDIRARKILSKRHKGSVFPAPPRCCLSACDDYARANRLAREASGKSLSKQSHAILKKIEPPL